MAIASGGFLIGTGWMYQEDSFRFTLPQNSSAFVGPFCHTIKITSHYDSSSRRRTGVV
jgi:hypothetical protein